MRHLLDTRGFIAHEIVDAFESATKNGFGKAALHSGNLKKTLQTEYGIDDVNKAPLMVLIDAWKKEVDDINGIVEVDQSVRREDGAGFATLGEYGDRTIVMLICWRVVYSF